MLEQISSIITLQQHDVEVDELAKKASAFDSLIKKKSLAADALKTDLKSAKDKLTAAQLKKKELEGEAEAKQKLVQKHQSELNSLKSNDAYKAMLSEIEGAKAAVVQIEDQILVAMETIDTADKTFKENEKKLKSDEAALKAEVSALEGQKAAAGAAAAQRKEARDAFAKAIPAAILARYDTIRAKRDGIAIVAMINNSCAGCHMTLPPHTVNDVKTAKAVVICESCNRILYNPAPVDAPSVAPAS